MKAITLILCFLAAIQFTNAQEKNPNTPEQRAEFRAEKLSQELKLDNEQKLKIKSIFLRAAMKNDEIRANQAMTQAQRDEQIEKNNTILKDKIRTVMNEEQRKTFNEKEKEREAYKAKKKKPEKVNPAEEL